MGFRAKSRYVIQSVSPSGAYLRFESPKDRTMTQEELCDKIRQIADLIDPRLTSEDKTRLWNASVQVQGAGSPTAHRG